MAGSKFQGLFDAARQRELAEPLSKNIGTQNLEYLDIQKDNSGEAPKRGRPKGKRSDPDYEQFSVYLRKTTHTGVKIALLQEGQGREISELVEDLLSDWLNLDA